MPVTEEWVEFATDRSPETLRDIIPSDLDISLNVSNTLSRDLPMMRKQLQEFVQGVVAPLIPILAQEGKKFSAYKFVKKMAENFEGIDSADEFFESMPMPQAPQQGGPEQGMPQGGQEIPISGGQMPLQETPGEVPPVDPGAMQI